MVQFVYSSEIVVLIYTLPQRSILHTYNLRTRLILPRSPLSPRVNILLKNRLSDGLQAIAPNGPDLGLIMHRQKCSV